MTKKYDSIAINAEMQTLDNAAFAEMQMKSDIEKLYLQKLEHETFMLKLARAIKQRENTAKKYGMTDALKNEIRDKKVELARETQAANDCGKELAAAAYQMNDREKNLCIATNFFENGHLFAFVGDDAHRYADTVERVKIVVTAIIERTKTMDATAMSEKSTRWLHIMDKYEYRVMKKALEYVGFGLYAQSIKFNSGDVTNLLVACMKSTKDGTVLQDDTKILKSIVSAINNKQYSAIQTDANGKKTTKNKK